MTSYLKDTPGLGKSSTVSTNASTAAILLSLDILGYLKIYQQSMHDRAIFVGMIVLIRRTRVLATVNYVNMQPRIN